MCPLVRRLGFGLALASVASLGACDGAPRRDGAEAHARASLARDGFTALELNPVDGEPGRFEFSGDNEGLRCHGEIVVRGEGARRTSAISSRCPPQN